MPFHLDFVAFGAGELVRWGKLSLRDGGSFREDGTGAEVNLELGALTRVPVRPGQLGR